VSQSITIEVVGRRIYLRGNTYPHRDTLRRLGCTTTKESGSWETWIGTAKRAAIEQWLESIDPARVVTEPTAGSRAIAESLGLDRETPCGIVADKLEDAGRLREARRIRDGLTAQLPPDEVRLAGKVKYKGRIWYLASSIRLTALGSPHQAHLVGLPRPDGTYTEFWVDSQLCEPVKTYHPRQVWDGRPRVFNRTITQYTTLGSIADFIRQQQDPATARGQCVECGHWGPSGEPCSGCCGEGVHQ
jgi:hypothetical protein